jgi:hypothetical protein
MTTYFFSPNMLIRTMEIISYTVGGTEIASEHLY